MSKQYGEHDNSGVLSTGHIGGFCLHVLGLLGVLIGFVCGVESKILFWEVSPFWSLPLMAVSIVVAVFSLAWVGIIPFYCSWGSGQYLWYDPGKKEWYKTKEYMGLNW